MGTNDTINLNELTERELLIMLNSKVEELDTKVDRITTQEVENRVKIATIETRAKVLGSIYGVIFSTVISIFSQLLKKL